MLVLNGVIPIIYKGVTYQIPVMIWCRPHYPNDAPVPYVRPTSSMVIRERHANVDKEGRVYLQHYLSIWDPSQYSLYGLVLAMIRVFSVEPPVNSRPSVQGNANDESERRRLINTLSKRVSERLTDVNNDAVGELGQLLQRQEFVAKSDANANREAEQTKHELMNSTITLQQLTQRKQELDKWRLGIDMAARQNSDDATVVSDSDEVDSVLHYDDILVHQIAESMAKDHAYTDTLDQVDEAFVKGVIDHESYMKDVRNLSREQFFPRALRKKLELARQRAYLAEHNPSVAGSGKTEDGEHVPIYGSASSGLHTAPTVAQYV